MATNVIMPQMGESIFEGTVTKWLKKVGDPVKRDEPLFEISTDKVDSEIPSPAAGVLTEILVPEGQTVQINTVVAILDGGSEATATASSAKPAASAPSQSTSTLTAAASPKAVPATEPSTPDELAGDVRSSPLVRRMVKEYKIDLKKVSGSGVGGRITKQDIENYLAAGGKKPPVNAGASPSTPVTSPTASLSPAVAPTPAISGPSTASQGHTTLEPMSAMRKQIAEHMVLSKRTSAHVNTIFEIDVTNLMRLREREQTSFQRANGVKLTFTSFVAQAVVDPLKQFPILNSSVEGTNIIYKKDINLGIAVALDWGLIVPVVKNAGEKSFIDIAKAIADLAERARSKKLKPEEVQNGTFTITNPGVFGSLFGTPIINQPQVAILGVGAITKRPVVIENDAIAIRSMVIFSLSFDHRVVDGAVADQFMAAIKKRIERWNSF